MKADHIDLERAKTFAAGRNFKPGQIALLAEAFAEHRIAATEPMRDALNLALEYWAHRLQRYKKRHPVWVTAAREALGIGPKVQR